MRVRSLKGRLVVIILGIYLLVGCLAVFAFVLAARAIAANFGMRFAQQHALLDKSRILTPVEREVALARKLADSDLLRNWCGAEENPALKAQALAELESYRRMFMDHSYFFVVDPSRHYYFNNAQNQFRGHELRYTLNSQDPSMAWYFSTMKTVDDFALHVDSSEQLGLYKLWINVVVKNGDRKVGLAGTGLDLSGFLKEIVQSGEKGVVTVLVDRQGFLQAHPNAHYMEFNARMKDESRRMTIFQLLGSQGDRDLLQARMGRLVRGEAAVETFNLTLEGRRYLAAATYMKDIDWITLVFVDQSQVIGLRSFAPILLFLLLSLVVTLGLVSAMLNRLVVKPLERLTASSQQIASGNYDLELVADREDEIGRLTTAFGHMTATVRDHLNHLEEKVRERTEALSAANDRLSAINRKLTDSIQYAHLI
jgi:HAMP domain-containing protein